MRSETCRVAVVALAALAAFTWPTATEAQNGSGASSRSGEVRVYLDCQSRRNCDRTHFLTEIDYVTWVRDRQDSNVHLIFTSSGAGSGRHYQLDFEGREEFSHLEDRLSFTSRGTDVRAEVLDGITHTLELGLARFLVEAGRGGDLALEFTGERREVEGEATEDGPLNPAQVEDPWDFWTFRFGLSGSLDMEERRERWNFRPSANADRVTDEWKVNLSAWANLRRERIQLSGEGEEEHVVRNDRDTWSTSALVVRSVTPHISVGIDTEARRSERRNQDLRVNLAPAIEWNYYPYAESNRRQLIAHYGIGFEYADYMETTIFEAESETIPRHRVAVQYNAREGWGNARVGFETSQYLHNTSYYSAGFQGSLSYRIRRGLEVEVSGSASYVNDQIYIPQEDAADEDVLLGRRALPTGHEYEASLGFNYRFGSVYDNIVNTRFPRSVR